MNKTAGIVIGLMGLLASVGAVVRFWFGRPRRRVPGGAFPLHTRQLEGSSTGRRHIPWG